MEKDYWTSVCEYAEAWYTGADGTEEELTNPTYIKKWLLDDDLWTDEDRYFLEGRDEEDIAWLVGDIADTVREWIEAEEKV